MFSKCDEFNFGFNFWCSGIRILISTKLIYIILFDLFFGCHLNSNNQCGIFVVHITRTYFGFCNIFL
jgi:hypothetical protein